MVEITRVPVNTDTQFLFKYPIRHGLPEFREEIREWFRNAEIKEFKIEKMGWTTFDICFYREEDAVTFKMKWGSSALEW
jgi:hypothetical protein